MVLMFPMGLTNYVNAEDWGNGGNLNGALSKDGSVRGYAGELDCSDLLISLGVYQFDLDSPNSSPLRYLCPRAQVLVG